MQHSAAIQHKTALLAAIPLTLLLSSCQLSNGSNTGSVDARNQTEIAAELLRMEVRIANEVQSLSNYTVNGFKAINDMSLVVTAGVHDHYLITLAVPCLGLPYAFTVGFEQRSINISNFDNILVNSLHQRVERCPIARIYHLEDVETDGDDEAAQ